MVYNVGSVLHRDLAHVKWLACIALSWDWISKRFDDWRTSKSSHSFPRRQTWLAYSTWSRVKWVNWRLRGWLFWTLQVPVSSRMIWRWRLSLRVTSLKPRQASNHGWECHSSEYFLVLQTPLVMRSTKPCSAVDGWSMPAFAVVCVLEIWPATNTNPICIA
jgi:hypothetical protein